MNHTNFPELITQKEDRELYKLQCEIINNVSYSDDEKSLRLAILQTLTPIDDFESAAEIIRNHTTALHGEHILIAAYIAITAYEMVRYPNVEYFIALLDKSYDLEDDDFRSIADYLRAKYLKASGASDATVIKMLNNSIAIYPYTPMHLVLLSEYKQFDEKISLLERALCAVKKVLSAEELWCMPMSYFAEPDNVMKTITCVEVTESYYNNLKKRLSDVDYADRYDLFREALNHCGIFLLELSDEDVEYHVFEEFEGDCYSFFNEKFLNKICRSGRITQEIASKALELSNKFTECTRSQPCTARAIKENEKWREVLELSDSIKTDLKRSIDETRCFDWFNRKVYAIFNADTERRSGYLTEYIDHPTVLKSVARGVERNESRDVIGPGSLTVYYKNGEQYSFECYTDTVFSGQFGITVSEDGERIYVISDVKGLWCYNKDGEVIWKTRYTSAGQVYPHSDGTVTCMTTSHLILLNENGKVIKKRALFDGVSHEMSENTVAILTSENVVAVVDVKTLEPIIKISLLKLKIDHFSNLLDADEYYVLQGRERLGIVDLPNGRRDFKEKELIYILDKSGNVIRKIEYPTWNYHSRAYFDREAGEVVLYATFKHHTSDTYRIAVK